MPAIQASALFKFLSFACLMFNYLYVSDPRIVFFFIIHVDSLGITFWADNNWVN